MRYAGAMTKEMTIDKLALATAQQFAKVDERFDRLEAGQARIERDVKSVLAAVLELPSKSVIEKLTHKIEDTDERIEGIDERLTVVEQKLATTP